MKTIALITNRNHPDLSEDDRQLIPLLREKGIQASPVCWDSPDVSWQDFDLCVLRSCWDYHLRINEFLGWLQHLGTHNVNVMNRIETVRWNSDKRYLKDLESQGISIVPTFIVESGNFSLRHALELNNWSDAIIKPCISASAHRTHRVKFNETGSFEEEFEAIARESGVLVQPFLSEIQSNGEWSFIFFDRQFSHAVLKVPRLGEFRSQESFGGGVTKAHPTQELLAEAEKVISAVRGDILYARVDMVRVKGQMLLGELELIEPSLFLGLDSRSPGRFVQAILQRVEGWL